MRSIIEINEANFETEVLKSNQPVLVEFATGWSLPSIMFDGLMDEIATGFIGDLKLATVKLDRNPNLGTVVRHSMRSDRAVFRRWRRQHWNLRNHEQGDDSFPIETGDER
jgi:hypothetical protein